MKIVLVGFACIVLAVMGYVAFGVIGMIAMPIILIAVPWVMLRRLAYQRAHTIIVEHKRKR